MSFQTILFFLLLHTKLDVSIIYGKCDRFSHATWLQMRSESFSIQLDCINHHPSCIQKQKFRHKIFFCVSQKRKIRFRMTWGVSNDRMSIFFFFFENRYFQHAWLFEMPSISPWTSACKWHTHFFFQFDSEVDDKSSTWDLQSSVTEEEVKKLYLLCLKPRYGILSMGVFLSFMYLYSATRKACSSVRHSSPPSTFGLSSGVTFFQLLPLLLFLGLATPDFESTFI